MSEPQRIFVVEIEATRRSNETQSWLALFERLANTSQASELLQAMPAIVRNEDDDRLVRLRWVEIRAHDAARALVDVAAFLGALLDGPISLDAERVTCSVREAAAPADAGSPAE